MSKLEPFISIVIPTYNRADYLPKALESAIAQDYPNLEILVVDDGSTDDTKSIIEKIEEPRLKYILKERSGQPQTRNRGIEEAKGEFILWLDSDDALLPNVLPAYLSTLQKFPDADVLYGDFIICDKKLLKLEIKHMVDWYGKGPERLASMIYGTPIPNPGSMVRKFCYEWYGQYNLSFSRAIDYEFWSRLDSSVSFKHVGCPVVKYRLHDNNISNLDWSSLSDEARILKNLVERHSLESLFPELPWGKKPMRILEGTANLVIAWRLLELLDISWALYYAQKSNALYPSEMTDYLRKHLPEVTSSDVEDIKRILKTLDHLSDSSSDFKDLRQDQVFRFPNIPSI